MGLLWIHRLGAERNHLEFDVEVAIRFVVDEDLKRFGKADSDCAEVQIVWSDLD